MADNEFEKIVKAQMSHGVAKQKPVPLAALKRFSEEIQHGDEDSKRFYEINQRRIDQFLQKGVEEFESKGSPVSKSIANIPGVFDYSTINQLLTPPNLDILDAPECKNSLGARSRFGDGDGSFWDRWVNSDVLSTENIATDIPHLGFKRYINSYSVVQSDNDSSSKRLGSLRLSSIMPYAIRNLERKMLEKQAEGVSGEAFITSVGTKLQDGFDGKTTKELLKSPRSKDHSKFSVGSNTSEGSKVQDAADDGILPEVNKLSAAVKDTYFGDKARAAFFDLYRQVNRQRHLLDDSKEVNLLVEKPLSGSADTSELKLPAVTVANNSNTTSSSSSSTKQSIQQSSLSKNHGILATSHIDESKIPITNKPLSIATSTTVQNIVSKINMQLTDEVKQQSIISAYAGNSKQNVHADNAVTQELLTTHLTLPPSKKDVGSYRPITPRTKFVVNCLANDIEPKPHLLIRRYASSKLDISGHGIGDKVATILAESLPGLPLLMTLDMSNNKLTDVGISSILVALCDCPTVTSLNLSHNKVDMKASDALSTYFSSSNCRLKELVLQNADVEDNELALFFLQIKKCKSLKKIDLTRNLIGQTEYIHALNPTIGVSAGDTIAGLLSDPLCKNIETLILAGNMIRGQSATKIANSLASNKSLTYLDVSNNHFADEGAQMLGSSLFSQVGLKYLNVTNNDILSKGCYTIVSGVYLCKTLQHLNISENPIGAVGARAIMALQTVLGDDVTIEMKDCSTLLEDKSCKFQPDVADVKTFQLSNPYDRACCAELLRIGAHYDYESLINFKYTPAPAPASTTVGVMVEKKPMYVPPNGPGTMQYTFELIVANRVNRDGAKHETMKNRQKSFSEILANTQAARALFRLYDTDTSGALERKEARQLLKELGLLHTDGKGIDGHHNMVDRMFDMYDIDGSGSIDENEFIDFMNLIYKEMKKQLLNRQQHRYLALAGSKLQYIPPDSGCIQCELVLDAVVPSFVHIISHENTTTLINAAKAAADGHRIMEYALNNVQLKVGEATMLYDMMLKDHVTKYDVLFKLLPRMATTQDARTLVAHATKNDVTEKIILKHKLGQCYGPLIGHPNGYYKLNLAKANDKLCLAKLVELNATGTRARHNASLGDTSQYGNWQCFRNIVIDGKPCIVDNSWWNKVPILEGILEFDFMMLLEVDLHARIVSDTRLCNLLANLHMTEHAAELLQQLSIEGGGTRWEMDQKTAFEAWKYVEYCYDNYKTRDVNSTLTMESMEKQVLLSLGIVDDDQEQSTTNSMSDGATSPPLGKSPSKTTLKGRKTPNSRKTVRASTRSPANANAENSNNNPQSKTKNYATLLKSMMENSATRDEIVAIREIDALEDALSGRYLTCNQLSAIVKLLHFGNLKRNAFSSFRVEVIITFLGQVVDLLNVDYIFRHLTVTEIGILYFRIGWLNLWSPLRADGYYLLNFNRFEEKQVARILLVLSGIEQGECVVDMSYFSGNSSEILFRDPSEDLYDSSTVSITNMAVVDEAAAPPPMLGAGGASRQASMRALGSDGIGVGSSAVAAVKKPIQQAPVLLHQLQEAWQYEATLPTCGIWKFRYVSTDETPSLSSILTSNPTQAAPTISKSAQMPIAVEITNADGTAEVVVVAPAPLQQKVSTTRVADPKARVALMSLTQPKFDRISRNAAKPSIMRADAVMANTNYRLCFEYDEKIISTASLYPSNIPLLSETNIYPGGAYKGLKSRNVSVANTNISASMANVAQFGASISDALSAAEASASANLSTAQSQSSTSPPNSVPPSTTSSFSAPGGTTTPLLKRSLLLMKSLSAVNLMSGLVAIGEGEGDFDEEDDKSNGNNTVKCGENA